MIQFLPRILLLSFIFLFLPVAQAQLEITSQRNINTKVFELENGQRRVQISAQPIHYYQSEQWLDIHTEMQLNAHQTAYQNNQNIFKTAFSTQLLEDSRYSVEVQNRDTIEITSYKKMVHFHNNQLTVLAGALSTDTIEAVALNNQISYPSIFSGIDLVYSVNAGQLKEQIILTASPRHLQGLNAGWYGYQEVLHLPQGWHLKSATSATQGMAYTDLFLSNELDSIVAQIPAPVFFESSSASPDACSAVEGSFRWTELAGNKVQLETLLPLSWLKNSNRQFPVVLDPSLIQVGASTGGWMSGNNLINNPNYIFVGVCCGNLMHRGWILFNLAAIPDGSCIVNTELALSCASVGGAASERVFVNDVTGSHGPYTGTNPQNYADLADGTYTDFIANGSGMYPLLGLGTQASIDVKAALPSDFFQIALHFENEPSTNWKRFVGNNSSLHVTYDVPNACVLLQNQLNDFRADCDYKEVSLGWHLETTKDLAFYEIERSLDAINFEVIHTLATSGTQLSYEYTDKVPSFGTNYYRLKMVDIYGNYAYSNWAAADCKVSSSQIVLQPIPAQDYVQVAFEQALKTTLSIELYNNIGAQIKQFSFESEEGYNSFRLDIKDCPSGSYLIKIKGEGQSAIRQFVKK